MADLDPTNASARSRTLALLLPALLLLAGVLAYANSFQGVFLFDDQSSITDNPAIRTLWPLTQHLAPPRPLPTLSFAANYAISGHAIWSWHAFNLAVHLATALALFGLVHRTLRSPRLSADFPPARALGLAFAVALLWVVHPLQTQAVTYIVQRAEAMVGLFALLTLYTARLADTDTLARHAWTAASILACAMGMASKQVMVAVPLLVPIFDWVLRDTTLKATLKARWPLYLGLALTWIVLAWTMGFGSGLTADPTAGLGVTLISPMQYALTQAGVLLYYLRLVVIPYPQALDYGWPVAKDFLDYGPQVAVVFLLLGVTAWLVFRRHVLGLCGAVFFLVLAPTSSIMPIVDTLFEHRMYVPSAAVLALLVGAGEAGRRRLVRTGRLDASSATRLGLGLVVLAASAFAYLTVQRNAQYHDEIEIWRWDTQHKVARHNPRTWNNLSNAAANEGDYALALSAARKALSIEQALPTAQVGVAQALLNLKQLDEALASAAATAKQFPTFPKAHILLGRVHAARSEHAQAEAAFRRALQLDDTEPDAWTGLGNAQAKQDKLREAQRSFEKALDIDLLHVQARKSLGELLIKQQRFTEAIQLLGNTQQLAPNDAEILWRLAWLAGRTGRLRDAMPLADEALRLEPDNAEAHHVKGKILWMMNDRRSLDHLQQAADLGLSNAELFTDLGVALARAGRTEDAERRLREALTLEPNNTAAARRLARLLADTDRPSEALEMLDTLIERAPESVELLLESASLHLKLDQTQQAIAQLEQAVRLAPQAIDARLQLGWILATHPDETAHDGKRAAAVAEQAIALASPANRAQAFDVLAAAQARLGRFDDAVATARDAIQLAEAANNRPLADTIRQRLTGYLDQQPYTQPRNANATPR